MRLPEKYVTKSFSRCKIGFRYKTWEISIIKKTVDYYPGFAHPAQAKGYIK